MVTCLSAAFAPASARHYTGLDSPLLKSTHAKRRISLAFGPHLGSSRILVPLVSSSRRMHRVEECHGRIGPVPLRSTGAVGEAAGRLDLQGSGGRGHGFEGSRLRV